MASKQAANNSDSADRPSVLKALKPEKLVELDVRTFFEKGEEPFAAIMETVSRLERDQVLKLVVPFEPLPLFGVMTGKGFSKWSERPEKPEDPWTIYFFRERPVSEEAQNFEEETEAEDSGVDEIDVRGLEPPEPMERVLEALEVIGYGRVLLVRHHREPLILYDVLDERGFAYRGKQLEEAEWEIRIWRKA